MKRIMIDPTLTAKCQTNWEQRELDKQKNEESPIPSK